MNAFLPLVLFVIALRIKLTSFIVLCNVALDVSVSAAPKEMTARIF